jgi:uncharacterized spore protein YtfJ
MSDETPQNEPEEEIEFTAGEFTAGSQEIDVVQDTLNTFLDAASVDAVYGQPIKNGETLVIPTAEVMSVLGFGVGYGFGRSNEDEERGSETGGGSGGGGGGRVLSRPVAIIVASPEGVRVEPVVDATKIALAAMTAAGFMMGMLLRMTRRPRRV